MMSDPSQVIVTTGEFAFRSVPGLAVPHRHFPEVQVEGGSPEDADARLAGLLSRALDSVPTDCRSVMLEHAIEDVRAFAKRDPSESGRGPSAVPRRDEDSRS